MRLPRGFFANAINCGIKTKGLDLGLIAAQEPFECLGFFTNNKNVSYSVTVSRKNIKNKIKAILVNSGNANCFTHSDGLQDTENICYHLSEILNTSKNNIAIASTGIIGRKLPYQKIIGKLAKLVAGLKKDSSSFSQGILTTDTSRKVASATVNLGSSKGRIVGIAKGAGMVKPDLATMLAFILTDIKVDQRFFRRVAKAAIEDSFHRISIDGCTSTNDSVFFASTQKTKSIKTKTAKEDFSQKIKDVCLRLAKKIVKDAEGATKFISLSINEAQSLKQAHRAAFFCAESVLFKTAIYGNNPNWGRVVTALGQAGIKVDEDKFHVRSTSLKKNDVKINIYLGQGRAKKTIYTSDLTPGYVKINAGYS
jgi:glutamate N-acetyltransferase/amino-acid N-acetyltransferase